MQLGIIPLCQVVSPHRHPNPDSEEGNQAEDTHAALCCSHAITCCCLVCRWILRCSLIGLRMILALLTVRPPVQYVFPLALSTLKLGLPPAPT